MSNGAFWVTFLVIALKQFWSNFFVAMKTWGTPRTTEDRGGKGNSGRSRDRDTMYLSTLRALHCILNYMHVGSKATQHR